MTTRPAQTWAAASGGTVAASGTPTWASWAGTSPETVTDISHWSANAAGTFGHSVQLAVPAVMHTGDTLTLTADTVSLPVAS